MVAVAFAVLVATNGFLIGGLTVFDSRMLPALDASVAGLRLRDTVTVMTLGLSVPFIGALIDRVAVKPIIVAGLAIMAVAFAAYTQVTTLWQVYAIHILLGLVQATAGVVACVYLVAGWTRTHRGAALGILIAGSSFGNALVPSLNAALLELLPWRQALIGGAVVALALIPATLLVLREPPVAAPALAAAPVGAGRMLRSRAFVLLGLVAGTTVFGVLAVATNLALFGEAGGLSGSVLLFALFGAAVVAQLAAGAATYRFATGGIHAAAITLMLAGAAALVLAPTPWALAAVTLFGLGWGANSTMLQVRPTELFEGPALGRALAVLAMCETLGGGLGPVAAGLIRDRTASYAGAFLLVALLLMGALTAVLALRRSAATF